MIAGKVLVPETLATFIARKRTCFLATFESVDLSSGIGIVFFFFGSFAGLRGLDVFERFVLVILKPL